MDSEGIEFTTLDEARLEAARYAGEVMRDHPRLIWMGEDFRVEVTDEDRLVMFTVIVVGVDSPAGASLSASQAPPKMK